MGGGDQAFALAIPGLSDVVLVGRGGHGHVFRARQDRLNRIVAVKVMTSVLDAAALERFEREGVAMGTLAGHPNIVQVVGVGTTENDRPYLVMEYIAGGSLDAGTALPWREVVRIGVRLCGALATAHAAGILHRDLKPANVLLSDYDEPLLADFGIARVSGGFETSSSQVNASAAYAPPEVLEGKAPSVASDVYSLAATLHCLLAGSPPFTARGDEELVSTYLRISRDSPPDLRTTGAPDDLCMLLEEAMAKSPGDRPPTAEQLGLHLQGVERRHGVEVTQMAILTKREAASHPDADLTASPQGRSGPVQTLPSEVAEVALDTRTAQVTGSRPAGTSRRGLLLIASAVVVVVVGGSAGVAWWPSGMDPTDEQGQQASSKPLTVARASSIALGSDGEVYIADADAHRVLVVRANGSIGVFAGTGTAGNAGDGGPANEAGLESPSGLAWMDGGLWVAAGGVVRRISGDGMIGPGPALPNNFNAVTLAASADGRLYAADLTRILELSEDGPARVVIALRSPAHVEAIAVHPDGWLAVSDSAGDRIVKVTPQGQLSALVGPGEERTDGHDSLRSAVAGPTGVAFSPDGRLHFSEGGNNRVRVLEDDGTLRTVAGSPEGYSEGDEGDEGQGRAATFRLFVGPLAVAEDATIYIGDALNQRIRTLDPDGIVHAFP